MIENECQGHDELTPEAFFAQEYPVTIEEAFQKGANSVFDPKFIADCRLKAQLDKPPKLFTIVAVSYTHLCLTLRPVKGYREI